MIKYLFTAALLFTVCLSEAQVSLKKNRKESWYALVYKIPADSAEKYYMHQQVTPDHYLSETPFAVVHKDSLEVEDLPIGNYLIFSAVDNELAVKYYCRTNLLVMPVNNQYRVQLEVRNRDGLYYKNADVWVNQKKADFNKTAQAWQIHKKFPDEAVIKIAVPGDTLFAELTARDDLQQTILQQRWRKFRSTRTGYIITWPWYTVKKMIENSPARWFKKRRKYIPERGYVLFNKPLYKPGDTLKLKSYLLNNHLKPYRHHLQLYISYYSSGKTHVKKLKDLQAVTPGAFVFEMILGDTLKSDINYTLEFRNKENKKVLSKVFRIEDYVPDEITNYNLRSQKDTYLLNDTLRFFVSAKDANGLSVMDGKVELFLLTNDINSWYGLHHFIPDTLWKKEATLEIDKETVFELPANRLPDADIEVKAVAIFRNSNNELQEKTVFVQFNRESRVIEVKQIADSIFACFLINGVSVASKGFLMKSFENKPQLIQFPYAEKTDAYTDSYDFEIRDSASKIIAENQFQIEENYRLDFSRLQEGDSTGFILLNPYKIPVYYSLFYGSRLLTKQRSSDEQIVWKDKLAKGKNYLLEWQYVWAGEEKKGNANIVVMDKVASLSIDGAATVYPGMKDTITIRASDYKNKPLKNMNLTVVSYNNQLSKNIRVAEPPFLHKFRNPRRIVRDNFELDIAELNLKLPLGKFLAWNKKLGLDTMRYYQLLFPDSIRVVKTLIDEVLPEVAVFAVEDGIPQEIYTLYLNNQLVYYNGVTDKMAYSFAVTQAYLKIGMRLQNKYIELDSIYIQPNYKHDIFIDVKNLPSKSKITDRPDYWTPVERMEIENSVWQLANDYRTNNAYVWQHEKLVYLSDNKKHIVGPFNRFSDLQYSKPGQFDLKFEFEPGYEYSIKRTMVRLEKKRIFPAETEKQMLEKIQKPIWQMGDTIISPPKISYTVYKQPAPLFNVTYNHSRFDIHAGFGKLALNYPSDSSFKFVLLYPKAEPWNKIVHGYNDKSFHQLKPGLYELVLITAHDNLLAVANIEIKPDTTTCYTISHNTFEPLNSRWHHYLNATKPEKINETVTVTEEQTFPQPLADVLPGPGKIIGTVIDAIGGAPIPFVSISIKGTNRGTTADAKGNFALSNLKNGTYIIRVAAVGYRTQEKRVELNSIEGETVVISLRFSEQLLQEVVVAAYGNVRKREVGYAVATIRTHEISTLLQGKAAGISITGNDGMPGSGLNVQIRGVTSINNNNKPLYVINGVPMEEPPADLDMNTASMTIVKDATAVQLYGARAANGVIIITTAGFNPPLSLRQQFRDYAFWVPNLITDKQGQVKFEVTYPDNITSWQTFAVGMDKKRRIAKTSVTVKSFKPLLAQLSGPQFLIEGDSVKFIGKKINYTSDNYSITEEFKMGTTSIFRKQSAISAKTGDTSELHLAVNHTDTLKLSYTINTGNGFNDGELRSIPVMKRGTEEAIGNFWILDRDTVVTVHTEDNTRSLTLYAQNNTLDVLLDELNQLKQYPYYCMEQTASKLRGLVMEKKIRELLKQKFADDTLIEKLKSKLQKAQLFEGGWAWWEHGTANLDITNYITRALLSMRGDALLETTIRNALLYLQNQLPGLKQTHLLNTLLTLSEANHFMNFEQELQRINFDSLSVHEQWQYISIKQQQKLSYDNELNKLMKVKQQTMLGGVYWGDNGYWWNRNSAATTVQAFKVLEKDGRYANQLQQITQYFLETRKNGRWTNTVESASIISTLLPRLTEQFNDPVAPASLLITGDTSCVVTKFPVTLTTSPAIKNLTIQKTGGGMVYFTAWQKVFNPTPEAVQKNFRITTRFEKNEKVVQFLTAGEKVKLIVEVTATADAEYVQIEVPVPAGCTYGEKSQDYKTHKEYLKNKTMIFAEYLTAGTHVFTIELEARYSGSFHLNPAKAELMYFPTFFGRDNMKKIEIKK